MGKGRSKVSFYKRIRNTLLSLKTNSDSRIIMDCTMVSPLANDKGTTVTKSFNGKKRSLKPSTSSRVKKTGGGNKPIKF